MLSIQQLSLQRNDRILFEDFSAVLQPGEFWGMLGDNGCGKTTLLHALGGLSAPMRGTITLNDNLLSEFSAKNLAQQLGILFQEIHFEFAESVFDFCLSGRNPYLSAFSWLSLADKAHASQALAQFNLANKRHHSVFDLSGGEKRRLSLATLFTQAPQVYLLDEPTNHLDLPHQLRLFRWLNRLRDEKNIAVVMATHDINLVSRYCSQVILFQQGKLIFGPTDKILSAENLQQTFQHPFEQGIIAGQTVWQPCLE